jgi:cell division protein FtsA
MKRGVVVDIESTVQSIQRAIEEAELMAGCQIRSVYAGISGSHVRCLNSQGVVAIRDKEVADGDIERVLDAARAVAIPADQRILHVLAQEYVIDEQEGIRHPIGMCGVRLEARVHVVTGRALGGAEHLEVRDPLRARGRRSDHGAARVELRGADPGRARPRRVPGRHRRRHHDLTVFTQGSIRHTASLGVAGDQVTNDIAFAFRTPTPYAEDIKVKYACALAQLARAEETIEVTSVGDRPPRRLARQMLAEVVQKRYEELFEMAQAELRRAGYEELIAAGHRADRRRFQDGRPGRAGRGDVPHAGAHRRAAVRDGPGRRGQQPDPCDRRGPAAVRQPADRAARGTGK